MATIISIKIDVKKIDKNRLYVGEKGVYLDAVILMRDQPDKYGRNGMIVQDVTEEERQNGVRGPILGNVVVLEKKELTQEEVQQALDDLPF
jgi:hypothetical protein